jgi:hypothetical protein
MFKLANKQLIYIKLNILIFLGILLFICKCFSNELVKLKDDLDFITLYDFKNACS